MRYGPFGVELHPDNTLENLQKKLFETINQISPKDPEKIKETNNTKHVSVEEALRELLEIKNK